MRLRQPWPAIGFLLLAATVGCGPSRPTGPPQGAVLIVLDTMRGDRVSLLGHARHTTPNLDRLAERGVIFEQAFSTSPWTLPAMVGILSGRFPARDVFNGTLKMSLTERVSNAGFATAALTEGGYVSSSFGLDRGFDLFQAEQGPTDFQQEVRTGGIETTFERGRRWLHAHRDERFFLLLHTYEVHTPYRRLRFAADLEPGGLGQSYGVRDLNRIRTGQLPFGDTQRAYLEALYDGGVREADEHVGVLLAALEHEGLADRTLLLVTSDHGEDLGERFASRPGSHGHSLYDELLRVPLLVVDPTREFPVKRVAAQVRTLDIMPTMLELLGVAVPEGLDGRSLVPLMQGLEREDRLAVAAGVSAGPKRIAVRDGSAKLIANLTQDRSDPPIHPDAPPLELYDVVADPHERHNLVEARPEFLEPLLVELERWKRELAYRGGDELKVPTALGDELKRRLEALGYLEPGDEDAASP